MNSKYKYNVNDSKLNEDIDTLSSAMLVEDYVGEVVFTERAIRFYETLPVAFNRSPRALLRVGETFGIVTAEQVADWEFRRAEYEKSLK